MGDPFVRAVARLPANVRTKLLVAFVGTSVLLVAVGLLGQLVLGQSNDRVASVGPLQERAVEYSRLQAAARYLRDVLGSNRGPDLDAVWPDLSLPELRGAFSLTVDLFAVDAADGVAALTAPGQLGFSPPPEDLEVLGTIEATAQR